MNARYAAFRTPARAQAVVDFWRQSSGHWFSKSARLDRADQDLSVELNSRLGSWTRSHALGQRDIIQRFGRFPHRNTLLKRRTTPAEQAFLDSGGLTG